MSTLTKTYGPHMRFRIILLEDSENILNHSSVYLRIGSERELKILKRGDRVNLNFNFWIFPNKIMRHGKIAKVHVPEQYSQKEGKILLYSDVISCEISEVVSIVNDYEPGLTAEAYNAVLDITEYSRRINKMERIYAQD